MIFILSCILTKPADISSECFQSECDSGFEPESISIFFEPTVAQIDSSLTCRSSQILTYALPQYRWTVNNVLIENNNETITLSAEQFIQGDLLGCTIDWYDEDILYATGTAEVTIP